MTKATRLLAHGPPFFRQVLERFSGTSLHPQWHIERLAKRNLADIACRLRGVILDIGCAGQKPWRYVPRDGRYIGLDYYLTATEWYGTRPDVYGDAQALPLADGSVDCVLLLDVLEHLPRPDACLREVRRVLRPAGALILQVPFVYPIHDAPLDFTRWTVHGLEALAREYGFRVDEESALGHPLETAALLANIGFSKSVLNWIAAKNPAAVLVLLLPIFVVFANVLSWLGARVSGQDGLMPMAYRMVWLRES